MAPFIAQCLSWVSMCWLWRSLSWRSMCSPSLMIRGTLVPMVFLPGLPTLKKRWPVLGSGLEFGEKRKAWKIIVNFVCVYSFYLWFFSPWMRKYFSTVMPQPCGSSISETCQTNWQVFGLNHILQWRKNPHPHSFVNSEDLHWNFVYCWLGC